MVLEVVARWFILSAITKLLQKALERPAKPSDEAPEEHQAGNSTSLHFTLSLNATYCHLFDIKHGITTVNLLWHYAEGAGAVISWLAKSRLCSTGGLGSGGMGLWGRARWWLPGTG